MIIRAALVADLPAIHKLAGQLGYPQEFAEMFLRFENILKQEKQKVLVAEDQGLVVAWIHFARADSLVEAEHIEIRALVVDELARGRGVGRAMMEEAEKMAYAMGFNRICFGSNIKRERAHKLYHSLGYEVYKTSHRFRKTLATKY